MLITRKILLIFVMFFDFKSKYLRVLLLTQHASAFILFKDAFDSQLALFAQLTAQS